MFIGLHILAATAKDAVCQPQRWQLLLETVVAVACLASAGAFLFLVWRVCGVFQQFMTTSLLRTRTEQRIFEILGEYIERHQLSNEQMWSASSALSPC